MDGTGVICSYIRCSGENLTKVLDTVNSIFNNLHKNGITEDELTKAKNKALSALVIANELPMGRLSNLGSNWLYLEKYRTIEDDINSIKAITIDDIHSLIEEINIDHYTQLSMGPVHGS